MLFQGLFKARACHNKVVLNSNSGYGDAYLLQLQLIVYSLNIQRFHFTYLIS